MTRSVVNARVTAVLLPVLLAAACGRGERPSEPSASDTTAAVPWSPGDTLSDAEIEAGRLDEAWRAATGPTSLRVHSLVLDTIDVPAIYDAPAPLTRADLDPVALPLHGDVEGPSVLRVQVLLDRARFSPGVLDGRWGKNTEKAVFWFQRREGLPATGIVDSTTWGRLVEVAGGERAVLARRGLTEADVAGPFVRVPADPYRAARLKCLCYESAAERIAEERHTDLATLAALNPDRDLAALAPGDTLLVPDPGGAPRKAEAPVARIVVSGAGFHVHALDADGRILYHFPTTLGSRYDPSPEGALEVVSVHADPWFHYQPRLLAGADLSRPSTHLPPGPNNLVGDTWIKLSEPHYGIHGTRDPETIGYATSSGCVRLTNWDARFLRERIGPGLPVEFEGTRAPEDPGETADDTLS